MSASGTSNCAKEDGIGKTSRHTGWSIGFYEHRINLEAYLTTMMEMFSPDFTDDLDVWERVQARGRPSRRIFGNGDSDLGFVMPGSPSSFCEFTQVYVEYQQSQEKVQVLESQLQDLGTQLENERRLREEPEQRMEQRLQEQIMRKFQHSGSR